MIEITSLSNLVTDVIINVTDLELNYLGIFNGKYYSTKSIDNNKLNNMLMDRNITICQGGSPANTIFNLNKLGISTAILGSVGNDSHGKKYFNFLEDKGIEYLINQVEGESGVCYVLVDSKGERTNLIKLGITGDFGFEEDCMKESKIFHTSGYEVRTNPERAIQIVNKAKQMGAIFSYDMADQKIVKRLKDQNILENILSKVDILFTTEEETQEYCGNDPIYGLLKLSNNIPIVCLKKGSEGSIVRDNKHHEYQIPIFPTKLVNTCGAGDAYAAGFLYAQIKKLSLFESGQLGSYIASKVCSIECSHL